MAREARDTSLSLLLYDSCDTCPVIHVQLSFSFHSSDLQVPARPEARGFGPASDGRGFVEPQAGPPGRLRPSPGLGPA